MTIKKGSKRTYTPRFGGGLVFTYFPNPGGGCSGGPPGGCAGAYHVIGYRTIPTPIGRVVSTRIGKP